MNSGSKFRHRLALYLLGALVLNVVLFFFAGRGLSLPVLFTFQVGLFLSVYLLVLKLYRTKKRFIVEGDRKRYDILDDYIIKIKESSEYGINLIPVLINSLEGVVAQTEKAALSIGENFGKIVKSSKDGAEEADAVINYFIGDEELKGEGFGDSYLAKVLKENSRSVKTALEHLKELDDTGKEHLDELEFVHDEQHEKSYESLKEIMKNISESINILTKIYENISNEVSAVIISLQFQDITKQKIEHVVTPLKTLAEKLEDVNKMATVGDKLISEWESKDLIKGDLDEIYTMEAERRIMDEALSRREEESKHKGEEKKPSSAAPDEEKEGEFGGNVDLF